MCMYIYIYIRLPEALEALLASVARVAASDVHVASRRHAYHPCRGTSLIRNSSPLGPYSRD